MSYGGILQPLHVFDGPTTLRQIYGDYSLPTHCRLALILGAFSLGYESREYKTRLKSIPIKMMIRSINIHQAEFKLWLLGPLSFIPYQPGTNKGIGLDDIFRIWLQIVVPQTGSVYLGFAHPH